MKETRLRQVDIKGKKRLRFHKKFLIGVIVIVVFICVMIALGFRITYAPELENSWDAISAVAAWAGAIGTVAVLIYNHIAIELTQKSVRQAVDLQLFEKRLELYNAITDDRAFYDAPLSLKIAYNEQVYQMYSEIVELCQKRWINICDFAVLFNVQSLYQKEHGNVCLGLYEAYTKEIEHQIQIRNTGHLRDVEKKRASALEKHKADTDLIHQEICARYTQLEEKMRTILNQSINL